MKTNSPYPENAGPMQTHPSASPPSQEEEEEEEKLSPPDCVATPGGVRLPPRVHAVPVPQPRLRSAV